MATMAVVMAGIPESLLLGSVYIFPAARFRVQLDF
jgi:hypothetical protein